ncbi:MAG: isochorismate synthase [Myxococcota bacterium]|nr:isochorismate synthase [Myxococcota bacterium]
MALNPADSPISTDLDAVLDEALDEALDEVLDEALDEALSECAERATRSGAARILSVGLSAGSIDPLAAYAGFATAERFFWGQQARGFSLAARGGVAAIEDPGAVSVADAIAGVGDSIAAVFASVDRVGPADPLFVGGFAFDGRTAGQGEWQAFPAGRMVLPELLLRNRGGETTATCNLRVEPGAGIEALRTRLGAELETLRALSEAGQGAGVYDSEPVSSARGAEYRVVADRAHPVFEAQVASALEAIRAGDLEKVVLARSLQVFNPGRFAIPGFLAQLGALYPHCTVLAVGRDEDTLVAASPELLVSLDQGEVEACALAGSAGRGRSPEEDVELGLALRESKKEQAEHAAVARSIRAALTPWTESLEEPEAPELMRVAGIQHLTTPFRGRLTRERRAASVLDLVAELHPSPAVAGLPRAPALDWIAEREGLARGWYAGPVGWVGAKGEGEFWLALRSALVRNAAPGDGGGESQARLFAGAGLVEGSVPQAELVETRLKLRALLAPLTEI